MNRSPQNLWPANRVLHGTQVHSARKHLCREAEYNLSLESEPVIENEGEIIVRHPLKTAAAAFSIAALFGSVAIGFAQTTDTTSSTSQTTTSAPAPAPAVVY